MNIIWIDARKKPSNTNAKQRAELVPAKPLLEPSSPRITLMDDIICCAAGGEIEVA